CQHEARNSRQSCAYRRADTFELAPLTASDNPHLLVVDDDERLRSLLQRYLTSSGFRVTAAADAQEARALIKSIDFDCLVLDVMMPGESGLELASDLRARSEVPILMLTARGEAEH